jgi:phytoene dehydrogenase-like protein
MIDVAIVGAGLAGLNCAAILERAGLDAIVLEASDAPGGRVRTDVFEGFRLDRGFQVLLTAYPEAERVLDYEALQLKPMTAGALVWHGGKLHRFADPFRQPLQALGSLFDGVVSLGDKLRVASLREHVRQGEIAELFAAPEMSTLAFLRGRGFSEAMIDRFFRPFFGGVSVPLSHVRLRAGGGSGTGHGRNSGADGFSPEAGEAGKQRHGDIGREDGRLFPRPNQGRA